MSNDALFLIFGALLAISGGWISDEIRAWRERARELKSIKIAICDELSEIKSTIQNMHEVWTQATIIAPSYVDSLLSNTTAFDNLRTRLFLIKDEIIRKKIVSFYKKLKDKAKKSNGMLGSLSDTPESRTEQTTFDSDFQLISTEAEALRTDLEK